MPEVERTLLLVKVEGGGLIMEWLSIKRVFLKIRGKGGMGFSYEGTGGNSSLGVSYEGGISVLCESSFSFLSRE